MSKTGSLFFLLLCLVGCSSVKTMDDYKDYIKSAKVVDKTEYTVEERKKLREQINNRSLTIAEQIALALKIGIGVAMLKSVDPKDPAAFANLRFDPPGQVPIYSKPPQIVDGANKFVVQLQGSKELVVLLSYSHYKVGECVRILHDHPYEFPRLYPPNEIGGCE